MIAVHTLEVFGGSSLRAGPTGQVIEFLGGPPAAPVFMTLMGLSLAISGKNNPGVQIRRGLIVLLSGYLLNFIRGVIPLQLTALAGISQSRGLPLDWLGVLTVVDILQFAGLALIITALTQNLKMSKYLDLTIAIIVIAVSPSLWGMKTEVPLLNHLYDLLWGDQPIDHPFLTNRIAFPVFPWLAFPYLGLFLGKLLIEASNRKNAFRKIGWGGAIAIITGLAISWNDKDHHFNDYYHSRQGAMIFMSGFVALWIALFQWIEERVSWNAFFNLLSTWSKSVTSIYFIQWVLILWAYTFLGSETNSLPVMFALIILFTALSHLFSRAVSRIT
jgi:uncharacterized membrane protein